MGNSRMSSNKFARMRIGPVAQKRNVAIAIAGAKINQKWILKAIVVGQKIG
jgi:hypothetical protein